jgi:hypothetical protein
VYNVDPGIDSPTLDTFPLNPVSTYALVARLDAVTPLSAKAMPVVLPNTATLPIVDVPGPVTDPVLSAAHPVALPFAKIPVGAYPLGHTAGIEANAVAVAAFPDMLAALSGISALVRIGSCSCGSVPVVISEALIATSPLNT